MLPSQGDKRLAHENQIKSYPLKNKTKVQEYFNTLFLRCALVAQRIERSHRRVEVAGSNPVGGTTLVALRNFCAGPLLILAWGENLTLWVDDQQFTAICGGDD